jgi:hypothetical protein
MTYNPDYFPDRWVQPQSVSFPRTLVTALLSPNAYRESETWDVPVRLYCLLLCWNVEEEGDLYNPQALMQRLQCSEEEFWAAVADLYTYKALNHKDLDALSEAGL